MTSWRFPPSQALRPGGARVIRDARVSRDAEAGSPPVRLGKDHDPSLSPPFPASPVQRTRTSPASRHDQQDAP